MLRFDQVIVRYQPRGLLRRLAAATGCAWALALAALTLAGVLAGHSEDASRTAEALMAAARALAVMGGPLGFAAALAGALVLGAAWLRGSVAITEQGLLIDVGSPRPRVVPHEAVRAGSYVTRSDTLELTLEGGAALKVRGLGPEGAERLLDAIAAGATERALELGLRRELHRRRAAYAGALTLAMLPVLAAVAALHSAPAIMAVAALFGLCVGALLIPLGGEERVVIGHDGVSIQAGRRGRFVPWGALSAVLPAIDGVALALADGARLPLRLLRPRVGSGLDLSLRRRDHLLAKLRVELAASRDDRAEPAQAELLDRRGRPVGAWRAAVRALCSRGETAGYRDAAVDPEHLVRVLEARDAPAERRVGAAVALAAVDDPAIRRRVRVFIDTCAGDELRRAIEAADAEAADEELERALAAVRRM